MARSIQTVHINGARWKIRRARLRGRCGECDYGARTIRIATGLDGTDLLDTLIHELCHARWPDLHEEAVLEFATLAAKVLTAEGFSRQEDE
jgi:hypothetical protein